MRIVKKINNNVAVGVDNHNNEIVVIGKGIGFPPTPYTLNDLSKIEQTYYNINKKYYGLFKDIPEDLFILIGKLLNAIKAKTSYQFNPNLSFILADHINFALERTKKGLGSIITYSYELEYQYSELTKLARWFVKTINAEMHVELDKSEITSITMHFLNAIEENKIAKNENQHIKDDHVIQCITEIIETYYQIKIDKQSFNYFRFKNHVKYFIQRKLASKEFAEKNTELYESMKKTYPRSYECLLLINDYLTTVFPTPCTEEELLYFLIHINCLYIKEDCNRKGITPN